MVRIALVQFSYLPSYFEQERDYLSVEGYTSPLNVSLANCFPAEHLRILRKESRATYETTMREKISRIVRTAYSSRANLIVFPEYSIPLSALSICRTLAKELDCTIVAGSHRVPAEREREYASLGFRDFPKAGTAIAPIFRSRGEPLFVGKQSRSKWESDLDLVPSQPLDSLLEEEPAAISLLLCIDALLASILGNEFKEGSKPRLLICPSLSPSVDPFATVGSFLTSNDCLLAYVNRTDTGGTAVYASDGAIDKWDQPLIPCKFVDSGEEAILRADLDLSQVNPPKGSVYGAPKSVAPWAIPIVYAIPGGMKLHESLVAICDRYLGEAKPSKVAEAINNQLAINGADMDRSVYERLRLVQVIAVGSGMLNRAKTLDAMRVCFIPDANTSFGQLEANQLSSLQHGLRDRILQPDADADEIGKVINKIKLRCAHLPPPVNQSDHEKKRVSEPLEQLDRGTEWSIARFQNRGSDLDRFRHLVQNDEIAIIFITGPTGIGKTDFMRAAASKLFPGHRTLQINVYPGMSASQVLTEVAVSLGLPYDVDALDAMDVEALQNPMKEIALVFRIRRDQFLVLDDLALLYRKGVTGKDTEKLKVFFSKFSARTGVHAPKLVVCWSGYFPDHLRNIPYAACIDLKTLDDEYVRRIVERQLQLVRNQFQNDANLSVDGRVVALLSGHPLSAVTLIEYARNRGDPTIFRSPSSARAVIADGLLPEIVSDPEEKRYLATLSCIRRPISLAALREIDEEGQKLATFALAFAERAAVILPEGEGVKLHEAIREQFLEGLDKNKSEKRRIHQYLARLYKSMIPNQYARGQAALVARAEYVHHLVAGGVLEKTTQEARRLVTQIKRSAREVYMEGGGYAVALDAYNVAASISPRDEEIHEALGRCHARLQHWSDSDLAFQMALDTARRKGNQVSWILKNWGLIRARFDYYDRAEALFLEAEQETEGQKDPSILAARAYMNWKRGQLRDAEKGFQAALVKDANHRYSLFYFAKLLRSVGKMDEAARLQTRYQKLDETGLGRGDASRDDIFDEE